MTRSGAAKMKQSMGFEADVPRCQTCSSYRKARTKLFDGELVKQAAMCSIGRFKVTPTDCCDRWSGKDGSQLRGATHDR